MQTTPSNYTARNEPCAGVAAVLDCLSCFPALVLHAMLIYYYETDDSSVRDTILLTICIIYGLARLALAVYCSLGALTGIFTTIYQAPILYGGLVILSMNILVFLTMWTLVMMLEKTDKDDPAELILFLNALYTLVPIAITPVYVYLMGAEAHTSLAGDYKAQIMPTVQYVAVAQGETYFPIAIAAVPTVGFR